MIRHALLITTFTLSSIALGGCNLYLSDGDDGSSCRGSECDTTPPPSQPSDSFDAPDGGIVIGCSSNEECAAGCYCDIDDSCQEAGFCDSTGDCPAGFECDDRDSCVPIVAVPTCRGDVYCADAAPICPVGSTAEIESGCYTGSCMLKTECPDGAPFACADLNASEASCAANSDCSSVYKGIGCTSDTGAECTGGSANCSCESFVFDYCEEA